MAGILGVQHLAGINLDHQQCFGRRALHGSARNEQHQSAQQSDRANL